MKYKNIRYYKQWFQGNWYIMLPDFQMSIQLVDNCTEDDILHIIENEVIKYV